jgi:Lipoprotein amino terminal region
MNRTNPSSPRRNRRLSLLALALVSAAAWYCLTPAAAVDFTEDEGIELAARVVPERRHDNPGSTRNELRPARGVGHFSAPVSTRLRFAFEVSTTYAVSVPIEQASAETQRNGIACKGRMDLVVIGRRDGEMMTRVQFSEVHMGAEHRALQSAMGHPTLVRLGTNGKVLGLRFASELTPTDRQFLRSCLANFSFVIPLDADETWDSQESDATGEFVARYRRLSADGSANLQAERRKLHFTKMSAALQELPKHRIEGVARVTLSPSVGWLTEVVADETIRMEIPMMPGGLVVRQVANLKLVGQDRVPSAELDIRDADWDGPWSIPGGHTEDLSSASEEQEKDRWLELLDGVTLGALVDDLRSLLAADKFDSRKVHEARVKIAWLLRLRKDAVTEVWHLLASDSNKGDLSGILLSALGKAGTDEAQTLLQRMNGDSSVDREIREQATLAMIQLARPNAELLATLVRNMQTQTETSSFEATGMLILGALAARNADKVSGDRSALESLLAFEAQAVRQGTVGLWLNALGNAGTPPIYSRVGPYLVNDSPRLRGAAVTALRKLKTIRAVQTISRIALADLSVDVRVAAVHALSGRRDTLSRKTLIHLSKKDNHKAVRDLASQILAVANRG